MTNGGSAFFKRAAGPLAQASPLLWQTAAGLLGVVFGGGSVFGGASPLGLALVLGCAPGYLFSAAAGSVLGGLLLLGPLAGAQLAGAVAAALVMRLAAGARFWPGAAAGAGALLLAQLILAFSGAAVPGDLAWALGTAALAVALGWGLRRWPAARTEGACLWLTLAVAGLQGLGQGGFQPGLILLGTVVLALSCKSTPGQTAAFALALAAGCTAASPSLCFAALAMGTGALLGAAFFPGERFGCGCLFLCGCLLGGLAAPTLEQVLPLAVSAAGALALFLALPPRMLEALCPAAPSQPPAGLTGAAGRLNAVAETLSDIAETVNEVYRRLPAKAEGFERVVDYTAQELCRGCAQREACWVADYDRMLDGFQHLRPLLEEQGRVELERLPRQFCDCLHPSELCATVTRGQALLITRREERVRCGALRSALTEQYGAMAQAMAAMAEQFGRAAAAEPQKAARLEKLFSGLGLDPLECGVSRDRDGRITAMVTVARTGFGDEELAALAAEASRICHRALALPQVEHCRASTTLTFPEKPIYWPCFGLASRAAGEVCGDCAEQFCDGQDRARMILCDGMGTGRPAAVDGTLAARLTGQLLRAGFAAQAAARLVNVALSLKGQEESGATLDLLSVDLFTGKAELFKAGAAPSFLVREGRARVLSGNSLPVGILETVTGRSTLLQLQPGDLAVLLSDGALVDGEGWLIQQLELCAKVGSSPQETADILADSARHRAEGRRPDDVTVAVLRLERAV